MFVLGRLFDQTPSGGSVNRLSGSAGERGREPYGFWFTALTSGHGASGSEVCSIDRYSRFAEIMMWLHWGHVVNGWVVYVWNPDQSEVEHLFTHH